MENRHLILVAEDESVSRRALMHVLGPENDYLEASDGVEALALLRERPDVDLILLDLVMPRLDGLTTLKQIKSTDNLGSIPVIVCTAENDRLSEVEALRAGAEDFIAKPYDVEIVRQRVHNTLARVDAIAAQNRAEVEALDAMVKSSNERLRGVIHNTPGAIVLGDFDSSGQLRLTFMSDYWEEITGFTPQEYLDSRKNDIFVDTHPDDIKQLFRSYNLAVENNGEMHYTFRVRTKAGGWNWVKLRTSVIDDGNTKRVFGVYTNYNDEHERSLMMKSLVDSLPGGVAVYRLGADFLKTEYFNDNLASFAGYTTNELQEIMDRGNIIEDLVFADDIPLLMTTIAQGRRTNESCSIVMRLHRGDGGIMWSHASARKISEDNNGQIFYAVFTRPSNESMLYRTLVEGSKTAMLVASRDKHAILFANEAWRTLRDIHEGMPLTGTTLEQHLPEGSLPIVGNEIVDLPEDGYVTTYREWPDGRRFSITAHGMQWNGVDAYVLYIDDVTTEYTYRDMLSETNTSLKLALKMSNIVTCKIDLAKKQVLFDESTADRLGVPRVLEDPAEYLIAHGHIAPESIPVFRPLMERAFAGEHAEAEVRQKYKSMSDYHWSRMTFVPLKEEDGLPTQSICSSMDIDVQRKREEGYREQLAMRLAMSNNSLASAIVNLSKNTVTESSVSNEINIEAPKSTTADALFEDLLGLIPFDSDRAAFAAVYNKEQMIALHEKGHDHGEVRYRIKDYGGWLRCDYDVVVNPQTGNLEAFLYVYDVTDEIRSQQIVHTLTSTDYKDIFTFDAQTGLTNSFFFSAGEKPSQSAVERLTDLQQEKGSAEQGVESFLRECCLEEDVDRVVRENQRGYIIEQLAKQDVFESIYTARAVDGGTQRIRTLYSFLRGDESTILCAVQDISSQWEQEEQQKTMLRKALDQAEQDSRAKTEFLSNMSHEIRTPMNVITGMTKLAEDIKGNPPKTDHYLSQIDSSSEYLLSVLNDVLDMSRIESGKFDLNCDWIPPRKVMQSCIGMLKSAMEQKGITFNYPDISKTESYECYIDGMRSRQVIMNLLNNALKFTPSGGTVSFFVENEVFEEGFAIDCLIVQDTGCGMTEEFIQRAFEPFEQERNADTAGIQGTGLGLSLVKSIVTAMGGSVSVESELGHGSKFIVRYPYRWRYAEETPENDEKTSEETARIDGTRILLVEDHPLNQEIAVSLLEAKGAQVEVAFNGREGVTMVEQHPEGYYDAILMDIRMPIMDGLEATRLLRSQGVKLPIIAMSANAFDEDVKKSLDAGMNAHLGKPVNPSVLYSTIARFL